MGIGDIRLNPKPYWSLKIIERGRIGARSLPRRKLDDLANLAAHNGPASVAFSFYTVADGHVKFRPFEAFVEQIFELLIGAGLELFHLFRSLDLLLVVASPVIDLTGELVQ